VRLPRKSASRNPVFVVTTVDNQSKERAPLFAAVSEHLLRSSDDILARWRGEVAHDPTHPANRLGLDREAIDDHLPSLLDMLASCLRGVPTEHVEKEGATHGHQRRALGYTVDELLWEMSLFRRVLILAVEDFLTRSMGSSRGAVASEERAVRHCLFDLVDKSVRASVNQFMREAEAERDEALSKVADTTRRLQQANADLTEAHVHKDRFLSVLSHELRSPLSPILTALHILKRVPSADPTVEAQCRVIERQTRHLLRLIEELLDVNRIAYGKIDLRPEVITLQGPVDFAVESSFSCFETKGVRLVLDLTTEPLPVLADGTRISQIVMNLLTNAAKFTPAGGSVTVSLHRHEGAAVLSIRDTGAGIAPEILPRVFDAFAQGHASSTPHGGLGLGLMIARGLTEAHGGTIEARSAGIDQGAEFVIRLPLAEPKRAELASKG
jgi:signal transduction histidine kinase